MERPICAQVYRVKNQHYEDKFDTDWKKLLEDYFKIKL